MFFYCISLNFNDLAFIRACYQSINSVIKVSLMWSVIMSALSDQVINSVIIVSFYVISHYKCDKSSSHQ